MKRTLLAILVALTTTLSASAFGDLRIGATAGYNLTHVNYDRATLEKTLNGKNGSGWYAGVKARMGLFLGLGVDGALVYNQREYKIGDMQQTSSYTAKSFDIPLNARFDFALGGAGVYFAAGPNFSFNVGDKDWNTSSLLKDASFQNLGQTADKVTDGIFRQENLVTSLNLGAGLRFSSSLEVGLTYTMPMTSTGNRLLKEAGVKGSTQLPTYKANQWAVHATFYF